MPMTNEELNYRYERDALRKEMIEMAGRAASEIETLRAQIGRLAPKADAYDRLSQVLNLLPQPQQGYGEDVAHMLRRRAEKLQEESQ